MRVQRNGTRTRRLHALVYLLTFTLFATGLWLLAGQEGRPSFLSQLVGTSDVLIHEYAGWALGAVGLLAVLAGYRAAVTFVRNTFTFRRSESAWFPRWPAATVTGRFGRHEGHFDPGQRLANIVMLGGLIVLVGSGIGLVSVSGGPSFVWLLRIHKWTTYIVGPVIAGHVLLAFGIMPGYRGVWRAMHLRGEVDADLARRLWPAFSSEDPSHLPDEPVDEGG